MTTTEQRKSHWENIYETRDVTQVFWYQSSADKSLELIQKYSNTDASIIDMGCGASFLVDNLLEYSYTDISLLDTSKKSLEIVKKRINNQEINFLTQDILDFESEEKFDIWHDRAVFHFLQNRNDRVRYFDVVLSTLKNDGVCIISTFKIDGDISCAGLDVVQYDAQKLQKELPANLKLVSHEDYIHITPKNTEQKYIYFVIKKFS